MFCEGIGSVCCAEDSDLVAKCCHREEAACGPGDLASGSRLSHSVSLKLQLPLFSHGCSQAPNAGSAISRRPGQQNLRGRGLAAPVLELSKPSKFYLIKLSTVFHTLDTSEQSLLDCCHHLGSSRGDCFIIWLVS